MRWKQISDLINLNLCHHDVSSDLLNFRRLAEFFKLVEGDYEVGTWGLMNWLVSDHIKLFLKVMVGTG
jgi:NADH:ubiquinone oxidoreductase subunit H